MTASNRTYKAFVSSTFLDLKDHRAHVINSLRNAGFFVDPMENWTAESDEPKNFSQDRLEGCHLCVLLVAFRRGYVPDGETRSITQLEYDSAVKKGVDILPFLLDENEPWPRKFDALEKDSELRNWREHLETTHGRELFKLDPRSIDMAGALGRWFAKKNLVQPDSGKTERIDWPDGKSPYRGLLWFNQEYAPLFFGREREVSELIAKMSDPGGRALLVIGASGSGKSSAVAAGVWQALIKEGRLPGSAQWVWLRIQPGDGDTPSDALARKLKETWQLSFRPRLTDTGHTLRDLLAQCLSPGQELILFIDQMEELFTGGFKEPDIQTFLEQLIGTAQDQTNRLRVVATIRSEFLGKLETYESTLKLLNSPYRYHLGPVSPRKLQDMIEKPAEATGYRFEPGLVERILQDSGQEPGNLALVEYALKQLFERRKDRTFTVEAYEAIGGVVGAIATKADEALAGLSEAVRGAFDNVFAELVHVERERPPTRCRAVLSSFGSDPAAMQLIETLAGQDCRVFATSESKQETLVEVAHEKLFTAWPRLESWIGKSGDALRLIEHAMEAAYRWGEQGKKIDELWSPTRAKEVLAALEKLCKRPPPVLERFLKPQDLLIAHFSQDPLSHQRRAQIGRILNEFGDSRPGVGVGEHGLPDIAWVEIPHGKIQLRRVDHVFEVKPIRLAKYLVTNVQFQSFIDDSGYEEGEWWRGLDKIAPLESAWKEDNCPRENVSWHEAIAFCRWLSARTETTIRLPAEWEWQQAATGGDSICEYPWFGHWDPACCNSPQSGLSRTTAVGLYPRGATQQGVLDMAGNVWEWCLNTYEKPEMSGSTTIVDSGSEHVIRGGSWFHLPGSLRPSNRYRYNAGYRTNFIGFRLAQDIEP